jgi:hypothetical protein
LYHHQQITTNVEIVNIPPTQLEVIPASLLMECRHSRAHVIIDITAVAARMKNVHTTLEDSV